MKKILSGLVVFSALLATSSAHAQYHTYTSGQQSVEVDLSALDAVPDAPTKNYDPQTHTTVPRVPPVTQMPLALDGSDTPDPFGTALDDTKAPASLTAAPSPVIKRLLKPSVTVAPSLPMAPVVRPVMPVIAAPAPVAKPVAPVKAVVKETPVEKVPEPEFAPRISEMPVMPESKPAKIQDHAELTPEEAVIPPPPAPVEKPVEQAAAPASIVPSLSDLSLEFTGTASEIDPASAVKLDGIASQMQSGGDGRVQVRGYASGEDGTTSSARRIALSRALSVRSYLMDKGIKPTRVDVRALGSETDRSPVDRVDVIFVH